MSENVQRSRFGFAFEEDLFAPRVYSKALFNDSHLSFVMSAATNKTFYPIPEDGSPVTIPIMKGSDPRSRNKESTITQSSKATRKSLLIEYFEGGKRGHPRPSVRVMVTPTAARRTWSTNEHIQVFERERSRKPSYTRRILLRPQIRTTASAVSSALSLTGVSNLSVLALPIYADEISNQGRYTNMPPDLLQQTAV